MGGISVEIAFLPLRGYLSQVSQPQPRRKRRQLLPRSGREGRQRDHREGALRALFHRESRQGLSDALCATRIGHVDQRIHFGNQVRLCTRYPPQRIGLCAAAVAGSSEPDTQVRQYLPDGQRRALHRPARLAGEVVQRGDAKPRPASGAEHAYPGLQTHRSERHPSPRFQCHRYRLPAHQVRAEPEGQQQQQRPYRLFGLRHTRLPACGGLPQLRRSIGRTGYAHAKRPYDLRQQAQKPRGYARPRHE